MMTVVAGMVGLVLAPVLWRLTDALTGQRTSRLSVTAWTAGSFAVLTFSVSDALSVVVLFPLAAAGIVLGHVDVATRRLPDVLVLPAYPLIGAVLITGATVTGDGVGLLRCGLAGAACLAGYIVMAMTGGMGFGDAKLAGLLGLALGWLSWTVVVVAVVLAFAIAALPGAVALALRGRGASIPFGPAMLLGGLGAVLAV